MRAHVRTSVHLCVTPEFPVRCHLAEQSRFVLNTFIYPHLDISSTTIIPSLSYFHSFLLKKCPYDLRCAISKHILSQMSFRWNCAQSNYTVFQILEVNIVLGNNLIPYYRWERNGIHFICGNYTSKLILMCCNIAKFITNLQKEEYQFYSENILGTEE